MIIPGIIVAFLTLFAIYFVVDKDTNAVDSIKGSFNLVKNNVGNTIVLILLSIVVMIAGFLALCVGIFVAIPVLAIAWAYTYKVVPRGAGRSVTPDPVPPSDPAGGGTRSAGQPQGDLQR